MIDLDKALAGYAASRPAGRPSWSGSLMPGSVVGGWRLVAFVGRGRSAEVYRAESVRMGGEVALKLLVDGSGSLAERFRQEMEVVQSLPMKALPRFFGSGEVDGRPYYAMEYLQPLILPLPRHEAAPFAAELALAVAELHDAGYVHRDLKPQNVLRRRNGEPVLIDLGLVKRIDDGVPPPMSALSSVDGRRVGVGTPGFAAPEQMLRGESGVRSDVFSLGKMLRALCGKKTTPHVFRVIARKATRDDPEERYADAREFAAAVQRGVLMLRAVPWLLALAAAVAVAAAANMLFRPADGTSVAPGAAPADPAVAQAPNAAQSHGQDKSGPSRTAGAPVADAADDAADDADSVEKLPGESDEDHFRRLLRMAQDGDPVAQTKVAECYFWGRGVPEDRREAVAWYFTAADAGVAAAQSSLGLCLLHGYGCDPDAAAAVVRFASAAEQGDLPAMNNLALCLINGRGVERDTRRGFLWAKQAADRGYPAAQTMVGECYLNGLGVKRSQEQAEPWLRRAADNGNARARLLLKTL